jgi:quinol monooxygenase YgiN
MSHDVVVVTAIMHFNRPVEGPVLKALQELVAAVRAEDGCLEYTAHVRGNTADAPCEAFMFERWRDAEALKVHSTAAALTTFRERMAECTAAPSDVTLWSALD